MKYRRKSINVDAVRWQGDVKVVIHFLKNLVAITQVSVAVPSEELTFHPVGQNPLTVKFGDYLISDGAGVSALDFDTFCEFYEAIP